MVGIVVDQLRTDYIEYLRDYFGERGFTTLLTGGVYMPDIEFRPSRLDAVSATAMALTGAYPSQTGVSSAYTRDESGSGQGIKPVLTSGGSTLTNDSFTPEAIRLTTLADELAVASRGAAQIYSVAADPQVAVTLAGHAAKGAYWINNTSGNWATTAWYGAMPQVISNRNFRNSLSQRLDTMRWMPTSATRELSSPGTPAFKHTFSRQDRDAYRRFAASPLANAEVTDAAIDLITAMNLGQTPGRTDMIGVGYSAAPYPYGNASDRTSELTDTYLRLDRQLGRLTEAVERQIGPGNALIWLTSTGYFDGSEAVTDKRYRLPGGEFSVRKARSLLNSYLSARYGSGDYVSDIRDDQVYLNRSMLEGSTQAPAVLIADARAFLVKMEGVSDALTLDDITAARDPEAEGLRLSLDPRQAGDIFIRFTPGWKINYDDQIPTVTRYSGAEAISAPVFIMGPGIPARTIETPQEVTALAPTVAGQLRIRSPNGAVHKPIRLK